MLFWHRRQYNGIIPPKDATKNIEVIVKIKDGFRIIYLLVVSMKIKVTLRNTFTDYILPSAHFWSIPYFEY